MDDTLTHIDVTPRQKMVYGDDVRLRQWAADRMGKVNLAWPSDTVTVGVEVGGGLSAVILFNMFMGSGCCAHIATDGRRNRASRLVLAALFAYPFVQCGLDRITLPIARRNIKSQILALKMGFAFEGRLARNHDGDDEILMGMLREDCPWLKGHDHG